MTGLPQSNQAWPPKPFDRVLEACQERQVWWVGDPKQLAEYYGSGRGTAINLSGGRLSRAWQAFWATPQATRGSQPPRLHVPVAASIGRVAASILFSEPITVTTPETDKKLIERIDTILNTPEVYARMLVAAESASMLGGVYGRVVWDRAVDEHTWIDFVDADRAVPTFKWGKLTEVSFWTELTSDDDNIVWRHVEHHAKGWIYHGLYRGTKTELGRQINLSEHEATKGLQEAWMTGIDQMTAAYLPHHRPNPEWRGEPQLAPLGRSDLTSDVIPLLDTADRIWSSLMNDVEAGRSRMFVSENLMQQRGPGKGAAFDIDQTLFSPIGNPVNNDSGMGSLLQAQQFDIRVQPHVDAFENQLRQIISRVGYSPITFGLQDASAMTATEIDAKERDTNATRAARIASWKPGLADLATAQLAIDSIVFGVAPAPTEPVVIDWPAMHQQSGRQRAETVQLWGDAASRETKVEYLHPEWDTERITEEVEALEAEHSISVASFPEEDDPTRGVDEEASETDADNPFDK